VGGVCVDRVISKEVYYACSLQNSVPNLDAFFHIQNLTAAMRRLLLTLLICLPFSLFAQTPDSAVVAREVDSLVHLNRKLVGERKFEEALQVIEMAEKKAEVAFGKNSAAYGTCLHNYAVIYHYWGRNAEAEYYYLEAIIVREKAIGKEHPDYAASLNNLAGIYLISANYAKAEPLYLEAKAIWKKERHPNYVKMLNSIVILYREMGNYDAAKNIALELLSLQEKELGTEHLDYAVSLSSLATLYETMARYEEAEAAFLKVLIILKKIPNDEITNYPGTLTNLANLYDDMGQYEKAEPLYLEAQSIFEKILGKEHHIYAACVFNLGYLYQNMEQYEKAEPLYIEAKSIRERTLGKGHPEYAVNIDNLGSLYLHMGQYEKSELLYLEAKAIREKVLGKEHPDYARTLNNLANLYYELGQNEKAEPLFLEAIAIKKQKLGQEHPSYATSLDNLANLYSRMSQYKKADSLHLEAKIIREKVLGKEHSAYASSLNNLAGLFYRIGEYEKAELLYLEAKAINEKVLGKQNPSYGENLHNLATLYKKMKRYSSAETLYIEAKAIWGKTLGREHHYASTTYYLAELYQEMGRPESASSYYLESNQIQHDLLLESSHYLSEKELSKYATTFIKVLDGFASFVHTTSSSNPGMTAGSYNNVLFHKGFLLEAVNSRNNLTQSDTAATRLNNLQKSYLRRLSREYAKPLAERDSTHISEWEEKANTLEKELVRTVADYGDLTRQVSWQEVQRELHPGEAAVEFVSYRYYIPKPTDSTMYAALVVLPGDTTPHFIPLFEERRLQALFNRPGFDEQLTVKGLYGSKSELLNLLWQPLESLLRDVKTIYYSPAGLLHRINPAALLDESKQPLSANRQWVRVGSTRELVTGRLADRSFAHTPEAQAPLTALVYGGINYDMDSLAFTAANPIEATDSNVLDFRRKDGNFRYIVEEQSPGTTPGIRGGGDGAWEPLIGSAREAEQVSALLHKAGFRTDVRQGFDASEERIKKIGENEPSPRILHLATHGFAYPDPKKEPPKAFTDSEPAYKLQDDPMLRSGLVLAGANHYWKNKRPLTNREDGVLVAYEVRDLNLRNTELAVLSACQTGLGDVVGSEGVYGLQRAFRIAGAKFLIVSLWQVPDTQTQELMRLFYENWLDKQESLRDAFNHAQQTMREQEPNPYIWAGFVLIE